MKLQKAERKRVKLRLNIASPSGFGKTYSSLLVAYGLCNDWQKIAIIDTENDSAALYSHLGEFNSIVLKPPFTTEKYMEAIQVCEKAKMEVIIIDSVTHVWSGEGGLLEYQSSLGGTYQSWAKVTPLYQRFLSSILQSKCHVITTNRKKQGYNMVTENNRTKVEKAGMEDQIRDGWEYEMTLALEITNDKHMAKASKDRTGLFVDKPEFIITPETGKKILDWCNSGKSIEESENDIEAKIESCTSVSELLKLYKEHPEHQQTHLAHFTEKRKHLEEGNKLSTVKINKNGNISNASAG